MTQSITSLNGTTAYPTLATPSWTRKPVHHSAHDWQSVEDYFDLQENLRRNKADHRRTDLLVASVYLAAYALVISLGFAGYYALHLLHK